MSLRCVSESCYPIPAQRTFTLKGRDRATQLLLQALPRSFNNKYSLISWWSNNNSTKKMKPSLKPIGRTNRITHRLRWKRSDEPLFDTTLHLINYVMRQHTRTRHSCRVWQCWVYTGAGMLIWSNITELCIELLFWLRAWPYSSPFTTRYNSPRVTTHA